MYIVIFHVLNSIRGQKEHSTPDDMQQILIYIKHPNLLWKLMELLLYFHFFKSHQTLKGQNKTVC